MALKYEYMGVLRVVLYQDGVEKCKKKKKLMSQKKFNLCPTTNRKRKRKST